MTKKRKRNMTIAVASVMVMASGITSHADWEQSNTNWYYIKEDGNYAVGWNQLRSQWYYFTPSGTMVTGWELIDGKWYYFRGDGSMVMNQWIGDYYLGDSGAMLVNSWIGPYYVGADGAWIQDYASNVNIRTMGTTSETSGSGNFTWVRDMNPVDGEANTPKDYTDSLANQYSNAQYINSYFSPTYYTNAQYRYLTATIAADENFRSGDETTFIVKGDNGKVLCSVTISRLSEPTTINVDISGQKFVTIKGMQEYYHKVILADAKFIK